MRQKYKILKIYIAYFCIILIILKEHPDIDYFIYGHRHIELDLMLSRKSRMMIIGDWIWQFTYVVWDGEHILLEEYVEGESQL